MSDLPDELTEYKRLLELYQSALESEQKLCDALAKYTRHNVSCGWMQNGGDCTCGLQRLRDQFRTSRDNGATS